MEKSLTVTKNIEYENKKKSVKSINSQNAFNSNKPKGGLCVY